ncbi:MAG: acyltransferase family protein, partial [Streptomyces sp.]
ENWRLALNAVDYLAGGADVSPVQHFWSLGIQGQFYLIWPALLVAAILVARVRASWTPRAVFLVVLTLVLAGSLAYSVWKTATDQPWAYFDTGARLWELALGGIFAIALPWLRLPRVLRVVLGWFGLAALVSCGLLLQVSTMFPGYVALWPTGAAILIILAGQTDSRIGADRLLSARPLAYIGDISYALYLWHWPLLIFYRTKTGGDVGLLGGLGILAVLIALAAGTTWVTDHAAGWAGKARATRRWSFTLGLACLLPVVLVAAGWAARLDERSRLSPVADDPARYPGARALLGGLAANLAVLPVRPEPSAAGQDLPVIYADDCMQDTRKSDLVRCVYGAARPTRTIALVGNSHAVNWFPTLHALADANKWRIVVLAKGSCMLADEPQIYKGRPQPSCDVWQQHVLAELTKLRPDLVITTATHSSGTEGEALTPGMVSRWRQLDALGLRVLALRDTPRLPFKAPQCVETKGRDACTSDKLYSLARVSPILALRDPPPNVKFSDFTPYLCRDGRCPSVIGNVLVYWDSFGHFTATFARTLAPLLERQVELALEREPSCMRPLPDGRCG